MAKVVELLRDQHRRMFRLLDLLEREMENFADDRPIDIYLVDGILRYIAKYPDAVHRPMEHVVYETLSRRDPDDAAAVSRIEAEHGDLTGLAGRLGNALYASRQVPVVPPDWVTGLSRQLIGSMRRHMRTEEEYILPVAERRLTDADWAEIDALVAAGSALFDTEKQFAALYRELNRQGHFNSPPSHAAAA